MDGQREHHDFSVCREGGYDLAVEGIKEALKRGFRVTTNTTLFDGADPNSVRSFFDEMMELGVEGMMLSPGYSYEKAPDQKHFLGRARTRRLFRSILANRKKSWQFNQSPLFLEFLMGKQQYACTPWGMPTYNVFGWQKPCYLLQDGYADSFRELMDATAWQNYGTESGNPKCANCMVHSGYEASAASVVCGPRQKPHFPACTRMRKPSPCSTNPPNPCTPSTLSFRFPKTSPSLRRRALDGSSTRRPAWPHGISRAESRRSRSCAWPNTRNHRGMVAGTCH
jgi:hypothetical protein